MDHVINPNRVSCLQWRDRWLLPLLDGAGLIEPRQIERLPDTGATSAWAACVALGVPDQTIAAAVAARYRLPLAELDQVAGSTATRLLAGDTAARFHVVPLGGDDTVLELACADPTDADMELAVSFAAGRRIHLHVASPRAIAGALARLYPGTAAHAGPAPAAPLPVGGTAGTGTKSADPLPRAPAPAFTPPAATPHPALGPVRSARTAMPLRAGAVTVGPVPERRESPARAPAPPAGPTRHTGPGPATAAATRPGPAAPRARTPPRVAPDRARSAPFDAFFAALLAERELTDERPGAQPPRPLPPAGMARKSA